MKRISTRKLTRLSFLIALAIIMTRLLSLRIAIGGVEGIRIGLGSLPIIFAGVVFGPMAGGVVGAVSDMLGYWVNPIGAYMPHFTFTAFLTGFIPGFIIFYLARGKVNYLTMIISIGIGQIISSIILVPIFLQMLFGIPFEATLIPRIIGQAINIPVYAYLIKLLLNYDLISSVEEIKAT